MPSQSEITSRLSGDNSNFRSVMNQSVRLAGEAGNRLTKNLDLRDASKTMAMAVGANIQDISESVARFITGVSKEAEDSMNKLGEISTRNAELAKQLMESRLSEAQKIKRLIQQIADDQKSQAVVTAKSGKEFSFWEKALIAIGMNSGKIGQKLVEVQLTNRAITETAKKDLAVAELKTDELQKQKELYDLHMKGNAQALAIDQETVQYAKDHHQELELEALALTGRILPAQKVQLDLIRLQNKEKKITQEIEFYLQKMSSEKLNPSEKERLNILFSQRNVLDKQIEIKEALVASLKPQVEGEKEVSDEMKKQIEAEKKLQEEKWRTISITTNGLGDKELSDRELERKIGNLRADISQRELNLFGQAGVAGSLPYDSFLNPQKSNLAQALAEQRFREQVISTASNLGEDAAFQQFTVLTESRLRKIIGNGTEQQKQTSLLQQIVDQQKKGIVTVPMGT